MGKVTEPGDQSWNIFQILWYDVFVLGDNDAVKIFWAVGVNLSKDAEVLLFDAGSDVELTWKLPELWNVKDDQLFHCAYQECV